MDDLNQVAIAGRLTRDPQLRTTRNGTTMCNVRIACNKMFFNVKVWGDAGRDLAASTSRGDVIQVEGRLDWYEWSPGDGPRREFVGVVAHDTPGAVKCIASAPKPALVVGDGAISMGMGQVAEANAARDLASAIAAQSATVDLGFGAANPDPAAAASVGAIPQVPGAPDPLTAGVSLPAAPDSVGPIAPTPFQAPVEVPAPSFASPEPAAESFASVEQPAVAFAPAVAPPAFVQGVDAVPLPSEGELSASNSSTSGAPAISDSTAPQISEPAFASPTTGFVAPAMPTSLAGTEVPAGLSAYQDLPLQQSGTEDGAGGFEGEEIIHDENAALAADPDHEVVEEDNRFM